MFSFTVRRLIGAAAVVCLTASAVVVGSVAVPARTLALPGASESTVVTIEATRVADTRHNIGLTSRIAAKTPRKLTVTGPIDTYLDATKTTVVKQVVPAGATGVFLNVTVVAPGGPGFLAIRAGTATGVPATGGLNFDTGTALANGILVALPTTGSKAGQIDIYYGTPTADASTDLIIDVVGYTTTTGLIALTKRIETLETSGIAGEQGEQGPAGANGSNGAKGEPGTNGTSCTVKDNNDGTATMTCTGGTSVSFPTALDPFVGLGADCDPLAIKRYADLRNCDVDTNVSLYRADLYRADLYRAGLSNAYLEDANLSYANLTGANLYEARLSAANLTHANLSYANLTHADLYYSGTTLPGADLSYANLYYANLTYADLYRANLSYADLYETNLTGANLPGANLYYANLTNADLTNADLTGATLTGATLTGVTWSNTRCPDGTVRDTACP
jgi:hypothetical protein